MGKSLRQCRKALALSQEAMALQLGISRSLVGLVEKGLRGLPLHALKKLAELEQKAKELGPGVPPTHLHTFVQKQLLNCRYEIERWTRRLQEQEDKHACLSKGLRLLREQGNATMAWQERHMQKALLKVDALAQLRTQLQLGAWKAQKACLEAWMAAES